MDISPSELDDEAVDVIVDQSDPVSLIATLAYLTGDGSLLPLDLALDPTAVLDPLGGWSAEQAERARDICRSELVRYFEADSDRPVDPPDLRPILEWLSGTELDDAYATMLAEELAVDGDRRAPGWHAHDLAGRPPTVVIIGAGMSGILAAHRLGQAGVPFTVLEKNDDVGGTWFENTYPGCRVDVFNHVYAYSCAQRADWPSYHSTQEDLLGYFRSCADQWGIRDRIRFGVSVEALTWDERSSRWTISARSGEVDEILEADVVVSAVGQLNQILLPDIPGRDRFDGPAFHSARWDHTVDFDGRSVAVVGTGASALQFIPHLAERAAHLTVFQRTPPWLLPRPEYQQDLPGGLTWLLRNLPTYANWFRLRLFWRTHEGAIAALRRDPGWTGPLERAVSTGNDQMRELLTLYLESEFGDRPDLIERVVPAYPVGAKRIVLDDGVWARTLHRPDVRLVTEPIERMTESGLTMASGEHIDVDVVVYATGFRASDFLTPMRVRGRDGRDLHQVWSGDARAYLGMTVPGFPNLFCLYGPNTNIVINGSIIYFSECEVHYVVESIRMLMEAARSSMDCRPEVYAEYVERVDRRNEEMAWGISSVNSWYKSKSGRIAQNWPFPLIDYWRQTRRPNPDDYVLT